MHVLSEYTVIDYFDTPESKEVKLKELMNTPSVEVESYGADEALWFIKYSYTIKI